MNPLFNNVYVINMDRDKERLRKITTNLNKYNIKFQRIQAIEGKKLSQEEINQHTTELCRKFLCTKGIIGSSLSHMYVWDIISRSQDKWHMILEDDVEFNHESIMHVNELWEELSTNPDVDAVINLNCHNPYQLFCRFLSESDLLSSNMIAGGASAYMITPSVAKRLLEMTQGKVSGYIDGYLALSLHGDVPKYLVTKSRYVKHDFDVYNSSNMQQINIMPIASYLISKIGLEEITFFGNIPLLTINMTIQINLALILFTLLLVLNIIFFKNIFVYIYLSLELITFMILIHRKKYQK